jgi:hypothetical protein
MSTPIEYRLRVRNGADDADLFVITSTRNGENPYILEPPEGDGESLDPLTGKVEVGAYSIRVIDAVDSVTLSPIVATEGFEDYADLTALNAVWVETDTIGAVSAWGFSTTVVDAGAKSLQLLIDGVADANNTDTYRTRTFTGLPASEPCTVTVRCWLNREAAGSLGIAFGIQVDGGTEDHVRGDGIVSDWRTLTATGTSNGSGELTVRIGAFGAFGSTTYDRVARWDSLEITAQNTSAEGRIITGYLADGQGKQQLLSKRAFIEEREDLGAWTTITAGYVTDLSLVDALTYEFSIGSTQRIEQSKRVFDRCPNPAEFPEIASKSNGTSIDSTFHPTLDRASCIIGGPIVGNWGPYDDLGRPVFAVDALLGGQLVRLKWIEGFVQHGQEHPPLDGNSGEDIREFMNNAALEYMDTTAPVPYPGASAFQLAALPGLICRLWDDAGDWLHDHQPMVVGGTTAFVRRAFGEWFFVGSSVEFVVEWSGGLPSVGDRFRTAVFPKAASERNPFHVSGHPVEIACSVLTYLGLTYNDTSRVEVKAALGFGLKVHLRVKEHAPASEWLENALYGPFGFATRLNDDGEYEFFLTREVGATGVGTITLDDLHTDEGTLWNLKEQSAANKVVWQSKSFLVNDAPTTWDLAMPIDGIQEASVEVVVDPEDKSNEHQVFGDREIQFELPGEIEGYSTGTQANPGPLDLYVAGIAKPLFDWQGRGAIRGELHALRGSAAYNALIGETLTLDLAHFPSAVIGDTPVSQRGSGLRRAFILQKTRTPEGCTISFEDRGPADDPGLVPEFTLAPDATYPHTIVEVTITNELDLLGYVVRVEMLAAAIEPTAGQLVRLFTPGNDDNPFDLPPVCAGSTVWVRMRVESPEGEVGQWSAFQFEDLDDLTLASGLTTTVHGTQVEVSWTNGETDLPVEVLFKLASEDTYTTASVLPAGSTTYTLALPSDSAEYTVAIRYRAGPGGCVSLVATTDVITDIHTDLSAPINPAAWANGAGTFGMECDGTAFPSGTEFWVASETGVGTGLSGTYALAGELRTTETRMRFTNPLIAANDGMLRYLKARHRRGTHTSAYTAEVSVNPWLVVEPPPDPDPAPDPAQQSVPICVPLLVLPGNRKLVEVPEAAEPLDSFGGSQDMVPLQAFTSAYITGVVNETTVPDTCYVAAQVEVPYDSDNWVYLDLVSGPFLEVGPTNVGASTGKALAGAAVTIDPSVRDLLRVRGVIVGGDEDAAKALLGPRYTLWLTSDDPALPAEEEPEAEPPIEYPGSCTVPSPIDMDTGWSETGGGAGNVWTNQTDTTADLTLDGSETGADYWTKTLTVEPDQMHTVYIDVETDSVGVRPFLRIVGGDTVEADETGVTTLKAQIEECDGTIDVEWGVLDSAGGEVSASSDDLDYANEAAAITGGWTITDIDGEWSIDYDTGHEIAGSGLSTSMSMGRSPGFGGASASTIKMVRVFNVGAGAVIVGRLPAEGIGSRWASLHFGIQNTAGSLSQRNADGNDGVEELVTAAVTAGGDGLITASIWMEASNVNYGTTNTFYFAGLDLQGAGGGSEVLFRDLRYCLGSGVGVDDPDAPDGSEELPDPIPPGDYPPPPVGGARPFGIFNISSGGYGYWNSTVAALNPQNCEDVLNLSRTNECMNMFKFGGEQDWQSGGRFSYTRWKAAVDAIAGNSRTLTALEAAISAGSPRPAWGHFVIDEPFHPRWGGTIGMATLDAMCSYSKSLFPTWPTILRVAPNDSRLTRAVDNCDIYWGEYKLSSGDPARYRDACVSAAAALGKKLILGIHYGSFPRPASGIVITPAQLEHYGGILVEAPSDVCLAFSGWNWSERMYAQAGMPQAVGRLRDKFASRD